MEQTRASRSIQTATAVVFAASAIACAVAQGLAQTGEIMIAIDKMEVGSPPEDFEFLANRARWRSALGGGR